MVVDPATRLVHFGLRDYDPEIIAIDGKCLPRSMDTASKKAAIYMVSAWATQNQLVLGQQKVDDKSNEITAIPKLLMQLNITVVVVTMDAMGCQTKVAQQHSRKARTICSV